MQQLTDNNEDGDGAATIAWSNGEVWRAEGARPAPRYRWLKLTVTETLRKSYVKSRNTGRTQKVNGIDGNVGGLLPD